MDLRILREYILIFIRMETKMVTKTKVFTMCVLLFWGFFSPIFGECIWSIDFEHEWAASSGNANLRGNDPNNAYNNQYDAHLMSGYGTGHDSILRVGLNGGGTPYVQYTDLDPSILGPSGVVKLDFYICNESVYPNSRITFFESDFNSDLQYYWFIGLDDYNTVVVQSHSYSDGSGHVSYTADLSSDLSNGWHTMQFSWDRTVAGGLGGVREHANLRMQIDGVEVLNEPNALWMEPYNTNINLGSHWFESGGQTYVDYQSGLDYVWIDNVSVVPLSAMIQESEVIVSPSNSLEREIFIPRAQTKTYLSYEGRAIFPSGQTTPHDSSTGLLYILVNGEEVDSTACMMNVVNGYDLITGSGMSISWPAWSCWKLPYSPDWSAFSGFNNPVEMGDWPYLTVIDISKYIWKERINTIEMKHLSSSSPDFTLALRNVEMLTYYAKPSVYDANMRDLPDLGGEPVIPCVNTPSFTSVLQTGGGIGVTINGHTYYVDSKFSRPTSTWNTVGHTSASNWDSYTVDSGAGTLTAVCANYRLDRTLIEHSDRIEVQDKITNLTSQNIGVMINHEIIDISPQDIAKAYGNGNRVYEKEGTFPSYITTSENPTIYVCDSVSGLGLLPRDDVFRSHVQLALNDPDDGYGIRDSFFALGGNDFYTLKWEIYPTNADGYYDFINAARRSLNANYRIDGLMVFATEQYGSQNVSDSNIINLINANNAKYVVLPTYERLDPNGVRYAPDDIYGYTFGSGFSTSHGYWNRYWLGEWINRYNTLIADGNIPNVVLSPYTNFWHTSEPNSLTKYPDCYWKNYEGDPQYFIAGMTNMLPTSTNSYGIELDCNYFDWMLNNAGGYYIDESAAMYISPSGFFDYRSEIWDEHTAKINLATFAFEQRLTHVGLYTLDYRIEQIRKVLDTGVGIWVNFAPMTETESQKQYYHFAESFANSNSCYCHLTTPTPLGNSEWERSEGDIAKSLRLKLLYGGLYLPLNVKYQTGNNILQDLYPICPIELHCGYVVGGDKIVTMVSGEYGFGNDCNLSAKIYDACGFWLPERECDVRYDSQLDSTLANVVLNEGELAIVFNEQASAPSPANSATGISIGADLSWTEGFSATSHNVYFGTDSTPDETEYIGNQAGTTYAPGTLTASTTYYWRIDEVSPGGTTTGTIWSLTTAAAPGQATTPSPANSETGVNLTPTLSWTAGSGTTSHNVYFGTDSTPDETEYIGNQAGTTYVPGTLASNTIYYWRIDEVGNGGTTTGTVWSFTTLMPTFVAAGAVTSGTGTITPALPAGIATNDILLLFFETSNQAISISNQNGGTWTQVTNSPQYCGTAAGTTGARLTVFWSRYNGTQGAPTTSDSGDHQLGRMIAIRGAVSSGNPWDVTAGGVEAVSDTSGSIPGATTTVTNTLVVTAIATSLPDASSTAKFSAWTNANLTSVTERTDNSVTAGNGGGLGVATGIRAATGAYGNTAVTLVNAAYKGMMSIAIKP
ncbi:MAG TPA: hypothetical protein DD726_04360 [Phycisphaerales bacterium]|nr:hypothetical protein [Phycisphaerales bacterium]